MPEEQESLFGPPADQEYQKEKFPFLFDETDEAEGTPVAPETEETETPAEEVAPVAEAPAPEAAEETQEEQVEGAEPTQETQELLAGKYGSVDELVKGYNNSRSQYNREAQRARAFEEQSITAQRQLQLAQRQLQDAALYIQQLQYVQQAQAQQPQQDQFGNDVPQQQQVGVDPRLVPLLQQQALVEEQDRIRDEVQADLEARREYQDREQAIMGFFENHPEVEVNSPADREVRATLREWYDSWGEYEPIVSNPATLEIAYEASQNPELRSVLAMHPQYIDTEEGLDLARLRAQELKASRANTQTVSQVPAPVAGQRKPHVEKASTGNPGAGSEQKPLDPWEEAVLAYKNDNDPGRGMW